MVRLHSGPLFLSLHLPGADEPIVRLRVDAARFWLLSTVTVLLQPPGCHIGRQFTSVSDAMGQMARFLPEYMRGSLRYMEYLRAYAWSVSLTTSCWKTYHARPTEDLRAWSNTHHDKPRC